MRVSYRDQWTGGVCLLILAGPHKRILPEGELRGIGSMETVCWCWLIQLKRQANDRLAGWLTD